MINVDQFNAELKKLRSEGIEQVRFKFYRLGALHFSSLMSVVEDSGNFSKNGNLNVWFVKTHWEVIKESDSFVVEPYMFGDRI